MIVALIIVLDSVETEEWRAEHNQQKTHKNDYGNNQMKKKTQNESNVDKICNKIARSANVERECDENGDTEIGTKFTNCKWMPKRKWSNKYQANKMWSIVR